VSSCFTAGFGLSGFPTFLVIVFAIVRLPQIRNFNNVDQPMLMVLRLTFKRRRRAVYD
jgi:hypothetical protein